MSYFSVWCSLGDVTTYSGGRCIETDGGYSDYETCTIYVRGNCDLEVSTFYLETGYDYLYVDDVGYTGYRSPDGIRVYPGDELLFVTDYSVSKSGFDICCSPWTPSPTMEETFELVDGGENEGNVYLNGRPICYTDWDDDDAEVVCRVMGYDRGEATYGEVSDNFIMYHVDCTGTESSIWHCDYSTADDGCTLGAGVVCSSDDLSLVTKVIAGFIILLVTVCFLGVCCYGVWCCCRRRRKKCLRDNKENIAVQDAPVGEPSIAVIAQPGAMIQRRSNISQTRAFNKYDPTTSGTRGFNITRVDYQPEGQSHEGIEITPYVAPHTSPPPLPATADLEGRPSYAPPAYTIPAYDPPPFSC